MAAEPLSASASGPSQETTGLLAVGLELMALPFAAAVIVALAPVQWLLGDRK
jgi:hypothetical protein